MNTENNTPERCDGCRANRNNPEAHMGFPFGCLTIVDDAEEFLNREVLTETILNEGFDLETLIEENMELKKKLIKKNRKLQNAFEKIKEMKQQIQEIKDDVCLHKRPKTAEK